MIHVLVMGLPLAAGLALGLLAWRRGWSPSLRASLAVGAGLRLAVLLIAAHDPVWQPYDLDHDFRDTADAVLAGHDPLVFVRYGGWHFLPFMAYVLAGQRALGGPWLVAGRLVPVLADIALIPMVGRLAGGSRRASFQYACVPLALMVSALHGQFVPLTLALGVGALLAARGGRAHLAGLLAGLSVTATSWTVLLVPGVLLTLPHRWRTMAIWTVAVPAAFLVSNSVFLGTPVLKLPATAIKVLSTRPVAGDWGWSAVVTGGNEVVSPTLGHIGTPLLVLGLLAAGWWWRRSDPIDLTLVLLVAFLVVTFRFGTQYLLWPVPYLLARPRRGTWLLITVASVWAAFGYLFLTHLGRSFWQHAHIAWTLSSFVVIALLIRMLPARVRVPDSADLVGTAT